MEGRTPTSECEVADKIIFLHEVMGLGFRRVAKELTSQGFTMGKDKAHRLYLKHKPRDDDVEDDEELRHIKQVEENARRRLKLTKEKEERQRSIAALIVEELMSSYAKRKEVFIYEEKMVRFAKEIMAVVNPQLWDEFQKISEEEGYDLADALVLVFGTQEYYEKHAVNGSGEKQRLDLYLCERMRERLGVWNQEEEDESFESEEDEGDIIIRIEDAYIDEYGRIAILDENER